VTFCGAARAGAELEALETFWLRDDAVIELVDITLEATLLIVELLCVCGELCVCDELTEIIDDSPDESLVSDSPDEPQAASIDSIKI
jgi:hypothetical protein